MRKYILATIFIATGIIILVYTFFTGSKSEYTENLFSKEAVAFDETFSVFISDIKSNIHNIESNFQDPEKIKDSSFTLDFFSDRYDHNSYLRSIALLQDNYKIATKKDKNSIVIAVDSTSELDIVKWKRYEKGKLISSWNESFDQEVNNTAWFKNLSRTNNQIRWYFSENDSLNNNKDRDQFYLGYSYKNNDRTSIILFGISRSSMMNSFKKFSNIDSLKLIIGNNNDEVWELNSGNRVARFNSKEKDSITKNILKHYKRFDQKTKGIFNFKYNKTTFWNTYNTLPNSTGIKYYILSIPEFQILQSAGSLQHVYLYWISAILILTGLLLLFIKKKTFYFPKKITIPPVQELLKEDENRYLEFKSSIRWDYRLEKHNPELENVISKTIAAFCNTDGGTLLIGVDDDKNFLGLEKDFSTLKRATPDYYEIHLRNILHKFMGVKNVSKNIRIAFEKVNNNKIICKIKVMACNEPIFIKTKNKNGQAEEKFYVRSGNSSQEIKSIVEINDYINSRFKK